MKPFCILTVVVVTWTYADIKIRNTLYLKKKTIWYDNLKNNKISEIVLSLTFLRRKHQN